MQLDQNNKEIITKNVIPICEPIPFSKFKNHSGNDCSLFMIQGASGKVLFLTKSERGSKLTTCLLPRDSDELRLKEIDAEPIDSEPVPDYFGCDTHETEYS